MRYGLGISLVMFCLAAGCKSGPNPGTQSGRIEIGPNVRVSQDGEFPHVETALAADPAHPARLVISATVAHFEDETEVNSRIGMRIYYSGDGGEKWQRADVPELANLHGCNARIAFGPEGRGYFTTIGDGQKNRRFSLPKMGGPPGPLP